MIGLALVAAVGVLGSSLKDSVRKIASDAIGADYIVSPTAVGHGPDRVQGRAGHRRASAR